MMRFAGKAALVTGGGSGIGLATCRRLAQEGAQVAIVDQNEETGQAAAASIPNSIFAKADVSDEAQVREAVRIAVQAFGKIDVLVNNAAMMTFDPIEKLTVEQWDRVLAVNLRSVFMFCKFCLPHMTRGAIVNVSSVHAFETTANVVPYASSKGGMEAFVRALSQEIPPEKARVNAVAPGAIDTPMLWNNPNIKSGVEKPPALVGKPEDIAAAICFMAHPDSDFVNGTTLVVDGARLDAL